MDFGLTEEQELIVSTVRGFVEKEIYPYEAQVERTGEVPAELADEIKRKIRSRVREGASPRHVPAKVVEVDQIPYTRSGKKVEIAVSKLLRGDPVTNRGSLANPESLDEIAAIDELFA